MGFARARLAPAVLVVAALAGKARAQEPVEAVRTEFRAPPGCPDEPVFFAQVHARTAQVRRARPGEEARTLEIAVRPERGRFVGRLVIREMGRASQAREVSAKACDDVIVALGLIAALSIDPNAKDAPISQSVPPTASAPPVPATPPMTSAPPAANAPLPAPDAPPVTNAAPPTSAPATEPVVVPSPSPVPPSQAPRDRPVVPIADHSATSEGPPRWRLGAHAEALSIGTTAVPRFGASLRRSWVSGPSLGLGLAVAEGSRSVAQGSAQLLWTTATLEACPVRWSLASALAFSPCIPIEGGALVVGGSSVPNAATAPRPWITVGALARAELALGPRFFLEMRASVATPLVKDTFYFVPGTDVYSPPRLIGSAGLGVGITFP